MKPVDGFHRHQAHHHSSRKGTDDRTEPQLEVDKVTRTYGKDSPDGNHPQQTALDIEYHGETHRGYGRRNGVYIIRIVRNHAQFAELLVNHHIFHSQQAHGYHNAESHGTHHQHRIDGTHDSHLYVIVNHVVHKVYNRHSRHDEQRASQQRMIRSSRQPCKSSDISKAGGHQCRDGDTHI